MRSLRSGLVAACCGAALVLSGCPDKSSTTPAVDSGVATGPETPKAPPPATFTVGYEAPDAGMTPLSLEPDNEPLIEPTSTIELRSSLGLRNYRVRLFDEADRAVVSDDSAEESEAGLVYRIRLPEPLKTGYEYTLVVDAQTGNAIADAQGREVPDLRQKFQIAGEKQKPAPLPPPAKNGKSKKKSR